MAKYRSRLPQLHGRTLLADGGLETTLIFHEGIDLPHFAAFNVLRSERGRRTLYDYYVPYIRSARANGFGFLLDSATWRASRDWGEKLGFAPSALAEVNRQAIAMLVDLRKSFEGENFPMVISGAIGPRGDGYEPGNVMSAAEAEAYHAEQIATLAGTEADMVSAYTLTCASEAVGIARAARQCTIPVAISFTLETDGKLPTGQSLKDAILQVDAETGAAPSYYMINCAHPIHFAATLAEGGEWLQRLGGLRANASVRSHAELNEAPDLDAGDPQDLGRRYRELRAGFPQLTVLGGCCGTDHRHVDCIAADCGLAA